MPASKSTTPASSTPCDRAVDRLATPCPRSTWSPRPVGCRPHRTSATSWPRRSARATRGQRSPRSNERSRPAVSPVSSARTRSRCCETPSWRRWAHPWHTSTTRSRQRAAELARAHSGAATITRSLEQLGQALVDMRQAPDPRVPLEVTVLRLARREGNDLSALLQRIEAPRAADLGTRRRAAWLTASPAHSRRRPQPRRTGLSRPSVPVHDRTATDTGRRRAALPPRTTSGPAPVAADPARGRPSTILPDPQNAGVPVRPRPPRRTEASTPPRSSPQPPDPTRRERGAQPVTQGARRSRIEQLTAAFAAGFLDELEQRVRARFRLGTLRLGRRASTSQPLPCPTPTYVPRCEEVRGDLERALSSAFRSPPDRRDSSSTRPRRRHRPSHHLGPTDPNRSTSPSPARRPHRHQRRGRTRERHRRRVQRESIDSPRPFPAPDHRRVDTRGPTAERHHTSPSEPTRSRATGLAWAFPPLPTETLVSDTANRWSRPQALLQQAQAMQEQMMAAQEAQATQIVTGTRRRRQGHHRDDRRRRVPLGDHRTRRRRPRRRRIARGPRAGCAARCRRPGRRAPAAGHGRASTSGGWAACSVASERLRPARSRFSSTSSDDCLASDRSRPSASPFTCSRPIRSTPDGWPTPSSP